MNKIQVGLRWPPHSNRTRNFEGAPCVEVSYTFTRTTLDDAGTTHLQNLQKTWALLDTGADRNVIDEKLIPNDIPWIETIVHSGVNGEAISKNYNAALFIEPVSWAINCGLISMPHRADRPYGIILGRQFLQLVKFTYDGSAGGLLEIEIVENPSAI